MDVGWYAIGREGKPHGWSNCAYQMIHYSSFEWHVVPCQIIFSVLRGSKPDRSVRMDVAMSPIGSTLACLRPPSSLSFLLTWKKSWLPDHDVHKSNISARDYIHSLQVVRSQKLSALWLRNVHPSAPNGGYSIHLCKSRDAEKKKLLKDHF